MVTRPSRKGATWRLPIPRSARVQRPETCIGALNTDRNIPETAAPRCSELLAEGCSQQYTRGVGGGLRSLLCVL